MADTVALSDGRRLGYTECGDPHGVPLLYLHGAPGSRLEAGPDAPFAADLAAAGVRCIGLERAGYGVSPALPGRDMYAQAADVEAFADQRGLERFVLVGWSAGGPVALAAAARMCDRVLAVGLLAGVAPVKKVGLDGLGERDFLEQAIGEPEALRARMKELATSMREDPATTSISLLGAILNDADVEFTLRVEVNAFMMADLTESARGDYAGYTDDCIALVADWGFDLSDVSVPAHLVHGRDDRIVPVRHGRYLRDELPNASLIEHDADGHISVLRHLRELCELLKS